MIPAASLFHDEKFTIFYFWARGNSKIWNFSLSFRQKFWKKWSFPLGCAREQEQRPERSAKRRVEALKPSRMQNPTFFKILDVTPEIIFKILRIPLFPKVKKKWIYLVG